MRLINDVLMHRIANSSLSKCPTSPWEIAPQTWFYSGRKRRETDLTLKYAIFKKSNLPGHFHGIHHRPRKWMRRSKE